MSSSSPAMKVLVADRLTTDALAKLKGANLEVIHHADPRQIENCPVDVSAVLCRSRLKVDDEFLSSANQLKVIVSATSGFDHIDLSATQRRKITVMHTPAANAQSAAELTWAVLQSLVRRVPQAHRAIHSQNWDRSALVGEELSGKTLGVIGLGRVGMKVAHFAKVFGMNVQAYDPYLEDFQGFASTGLMELLRSSDIISLHVPLTQETKHLINHQTVEHIHQSPILINASRGPVVCEADLARSLDSGVIRGAALDVFEKEPLPNDSPLIGRNDVLLTPHIGANTQEAFSKASLQAAEKIIRFLGSREISDALPPKEAWYQRNLSGENFQSQKNPKT